MGSAVTGTTGIISATDIARKGFWGPAENGVVI